MILSTALRLLGPARLRAAGLAYLGGGGLAAALGVFVLLLTPAGQIVHELVLDPVSRAIEQVIVGPADGAPSPSSLATDGTRLFSVIPDLSVPAEIALSLAPQSGNPEPPLIGEIDTEQVAPVEVVSQAEQDLELVGSFDTTIEWPLVTVPQVAIPLLGAPAPVFTPPLERPGQVMGSPPPARTGMSVVPPAAYVLADEEVPAPPPPAPSVNGRNPGAGGRGGIGRLPPPGVASGASTDDVSPGPVSGGAMAGVATDALSAGSPTSPSPEGRAEQATDRESPPGPGQNAPDRGEQPRPRASDQPPARDTRGEAPPSAGQQRGDPPRGHTTAAPLSTAAQTATVTPHATPGQAGNVTPVSTPSTPRVPRAGPASVGSPIGNPTPPHQAPPASAGSPVGNPPAPPQQPPPGSAGSPVGNPTPPPHQPPGAPPGQVPNPSGSAPGQPHRPPSGPAESDHPSAPVAPRAPAK